MRAAALAAGLCAAAIALRPTGLAAQGEAERNALEFSPVSPFIHIYALQFSRAVSARDELIAGAAYTNVKYDHGRSHAPTLILGYRRYLVGRAHLEYQLWPSYNWYWEEDEEKYYAGPEVWNEIRPGYTVDFRVGGHSAFVNLQYLIGFALYGGNKPESFKVQAEEEGVFTAPMVFLGWRF